MPANRDEGTLSVRNRNPILLERGGNVRELLDDLTSRFPGLRRQIIEDEEIAPFVNVYVEGEDVRTLDGLETPVREGATVILLPAMAGGS